VSTFKPLPGELQPVEAAGTGTLGGRAVLRGKRPDLKKLTENLLGPRKARGVEVGGCLENDPEAVIGQAWQIDDEGGVANVFVWLRPPPGHFFAIDLRNKTWPDEVVIDQPHCNFVPHAVVTFPCYRDPYRPWKTIPTGQKLLLKNSGKATHSPDWRQEGHVGSPPHDPIVGAGSARTIDLDPARRPILLRCNIHPWMEGYTGVFDHPYAAVSGAGGAYEIRRVPTGARVRLLAWHEKAGWLTANGEEGEEVELGEGMTTRDFDVRAE
jgi:hypothetical protein